jgi:hypothetical protein
MESVILQFLEVGVHGGEFVELAWFHEHDGTWSCGLERPVDVKEKSLDRLVSGVGVVRSSQTRCWDAV